MLANNNTQDLFDFLNNLPCENCTGCKQEIRTILTKQLFGLHGRNSTPDLSLAKENEILRAEVARLNKIILELGINKSAKPDGSNKESFAEHAQGQECSYHVAMASPEERAQGLSVSRVTDEAHLLCGQGSPSLVVGFHLTE